jgi:hypothetical protein
MMRRVAVATAIGLLLGGQAMAAEARLGAVSGSVMVNQGGRFVAATRGAVLQTGDRVMATNGSASLVYSDGCNVAVATRSMATVAAVSPCAGGSSLVKVDDDRGGAPGYGGGSGGGGGALGGGGDLLLWGLFGIATAVAVGAAVGEDESPATP